MPMSMRKLATLVLLCCPFLGGASACEDQEACNEAIRVTRDAIAKEQTETARKWRDYAWQVCTDTSMLAPLDQEIVAKEAEIKKRLEDHAKEVADAAKKRMDKAQGVWRAFDKLDEDKQDLDRLDKHRQKAEQMSEGLPEEYRKQIDEYNDKAFARRKKALKDKK